MAISEIKKIQIIGHNSIRENVLALLHKWGVVEINDLRKELTQDYFMESRKESVFEDSLTKIQYLLEFLSSFQEKSTFLEGLTQEKLVLERVELDNILETFRVDEVYPQCKNLEEAFRQLEMERKRLNEEKAVLIPWRDLLLNLSDLVDTDKTRVVPGIIPFKNYKKFSSELEKSSSASYWCEVRRDKISVYIVVIFLKEENDNIIPLLKKYEFYETLLPHVNHSPEEFLVEIEREIGKAKNKEEKLNREASSLLRYKNQLMALHDYYYNLEKKEEAGDFLARTSDSFFLSGWIQESRVGQVKKTLEEKYPETEITVSPPGKGEKVPVVLENSRAVQPFEVVTDLFGRPVYGSIDPTPYLAPFFALFFGLCLTDAGYGIVLVVLSWLALKKLKMGLGGKRFFRLIGYGGLASIFWGAITGGWFGNMIDRLPENFNFLKSIKGAVIVFDPIKNSLLFLILAVALGFIQVWTGVTIRLLREIKDKDWKNTFFREMPALGIQVSLPLLIAIYLFKVLPPTPVLVMISAGLFSFSSLAIFYNQWTTNKGVLFKLFWCWFGWYGVVTGNSLADVLSYLRLFALGLTTGLLASAINEILSLISGIPYVGLLLAIVLFVPAHLFNIAMNAFGAYVHTSRLQYLEFFMKFFQGGGDVFRPFAEERRYTVIR
jgi:V/A-type H+-transporting ATPase subunit I